MDEGSLVLWGKTFLLERSCCLLLQYTVHKVFLSKIIYKFFQVYVYIFRHINKVIHELH